MMDWKWWNSLIVLIMLVVLASIAWSQETTEHNTDQLPTDTPTPLPAQDITPTIAVEPSPTSTSLPPTQPPPTVPSSTPLDVVSITPTHQQVDSTPTVTPSYTSVVESTEMVVEVNQAVSPTLPSVTTLVATPTATVETIEPEDNKHPTPTVIVEITSTPDVQTETLVPLPIITTEATIVQYISPTVSSPTPVTTLSGIIPVELDTVIDTSQLASGDTVRVTMRVKKWKNIHGETTVCYVEPTLLRGTQVTLGPTFLSDQVDIRNGGFQSDGRWVFAVTQLASTTEFNPDSILWNIDYEILNVGLGLGSIRCTINGTNSAGQPILLDNSDFELFIADRSTTIARSQTPSAEALPHTPTTTLTLDPTATAFPVQQLTLTGQIVLSHPDSNVTLSISEAMSPPVIINQKNGYFSVDLPPGKYHLQVTAPQHLPFDTDFILAEAQVTLPTIKLTGGDVNNDRVIDLRDVDIISHHWGLHTPTADLNGDGAVNIGDLVIVSANLGKR